MWQAATATSAYYRRLAEAKVFSYGNYDEASPSNGNYKKNTYGYKVPSCL